MKLEKSVKLKQKVGLKVGKGQGQLLEAHVPRGREGVLYAFNN